MLKRLRLNDKSVREFAPEVGRDYQMFDTEVRGFSIRILRSGSRTFALDYRFAGRQRRMAIGRWPEWTVTAARERAKDIRREIDEGRDPLGERSQLREAPRFSDMIDRYLAEHVPHLAKTNASDQKSMLTKLVAPHWATKLVPNLLAILNAQPQSRWTDLIGEGVGLLARELVEKAAPVPDLVEWFGEWAREARGEQRGLLLLTAHRAKGLEFDHVAVLNGGWDRPSRNEDVDAPRRLFYVAMTRAKHSLTLLTDGPHQFVRPDEPSILLRRVTPDVAALPRARLRYVPPEAKLVDLSYAGRLPQGHPSLVAIAAARAGDPVTLFHDGKRWQVHDAQGRTLARLSRAFIPPEGTTFLRGEVAAVLRWRKEDGDEDYHHLLRRDEWEAVLPELVFESDA